MLDLRYKFTTQTQLTKNFFRDNFVLIVYSNILVLKKKFFPKIKNLSSFSSSFLPTPRPPTSTTRPPPPPTPTTRPPPHCRPPSSSPSFTTAPRPLLLLLSLHYHFSSYYFCYSSLSSSSSSFFGIYGFYFKNVNVHKIIYLTYQIYFLLYYFLRSDPDPENLTGSGSEKKVRIRLDPDPQHCTTLLFSLLYQYFVNVLEYFCRCPWIHMVLKFNLPLAEVLAEILERHEIFMAGDNSTIR